ncbi:MAG: 3'-5' exonuclease [Candidatus Paceibacterota bacterium]|jgi:DNA polymerase-3 subunit epsilon
MKKIKIAVIDLETTGLNLEKHEVLEIGGVIAEHTFTNDGTHIFREIEEFEYKVKPQHLETADPEALRINHYNESEWLFAGELKQILKDLAQKVEGSIMLAHNVSFDWGFLGLAAQRENVDLKLDYHKLDLLSLAFAKLYHKDWTPKFSLWALAEHFNLRNKKAHSALADARVTYEIYQKLMTSE